jgi:hypothetical protein
MLRHRILIVSTDPGMRRSLNRLMTATGAQTEYIGDLTKLPSEQPSLLVADLRSRSAFTVAQIASVFPSVRLLCIVESRQFRQMVECLALPRCSNVIAYEDPFDPEDFIITVTKLLHGQIFGLQKYFPWGTTLYHMDVRSYDEKGRAVDVLNAYAELAGARGPVRDRITRVAEELIMNALYHAPVDAEGKQKYEQVERKQLAQMTFDPPVRVACASNGQAFAIAVRDEFGSLEKATAVKFLGKGTETQHTPEQRTSGAGLGLVLALKAANRLIFNIAPGVGTEAVALFDLDLGARQAAGLRSLHIFSERRRELAVAEVNADRVPVTPAAQPGRNAPMVPGSTAGAAPGDKAFPLRLWGGAAVMAVLTVIGLFVMLSLISPGFMRTTSTVPPKGALRLPLEEGQHRRVRLQVGSRSLELDVARFGSEVSIKRTDQ